MRLGEGVQVVTIVALDHLWRDVHIPVLTTVFELALARSKSDGLKRWAVPDGEPRSTGNMAFDEYREATLKRLEDERVEFTKFVERLRHAKDKAEFDKFMSEQAAQRSQE